MNDDKMIREMAGQMLDDMGYEVGLARDGRSGRNLAKGSSDEKRLASFMLALTVWDQAS